MECGMRAVDTVPHQQVELLGRRLPRRRLHPLPLLWLRLSPKLPLILNRSSCH
jgi:hypothetical protein